MNPREQSMNPNEPSKENTCLRAARPHRQAAGVLRLFVYGTLKRGCWNHERFCRGVLSMEEAVVRGSLYELPSDNPVLEVPEADVLARGTADPLADVATCLRAVTHRQAQARFARDLASILEPVPENATAGDWGPVYGELLTFDDPESHLPAIDRLEGFHPGGSSLYKRVLVPVHARESIVVAWLYIGDRLLENRISPTTNSQWPSPSQSV